jgi:hypothetical protein
MNYLHKALLLITYLIISSTGFCQKYQVEGTIRDAETRQSIGSASIIRQTDQEDLFDLDLI